MNEIRGLNLQEAINFLYAELAKMKAEPRGELAGMDPDDAFEKGYLVCIADLEAITRKVN